MKKYSIPICAFLIGIILVNFTSCLWLLTDDLGGGYFLDNNLIVKSKTSNYDGIGSIVVPPDVLQFKSDDSWIIASSRNMKSQKVYWIIDKRNTGEFIEQRSQDSLYWTYDVFSNVTGPVDSATFYTKLEEYQVELILEE